MKKTLSLLTLVASLLVVPLASLAAQEGELTYDRRVPGDRSINFQGGLLLPLFFQDFTGSTSLTNLSPGGTLALSVDFNLNNNFKLGGSLRGKASFSPNGSALFMVPITVRGVWEFKMFPFSFPVGLGAGFSMTAFRQSTNFDPILMPTVGAYWNMNSTWSFGIDSTYWWTFQLYSGNPIPSSQSRMGNFMDLTAGLIYHF